MNRGVRRAWLWRKAYWLRESPGTPGLMVFVALPLLYFLPLQEISLFGDRVRGMAVLTWLFSISLALSIRGSRGLRDDSIIWSVQKGLSPAETALEEWILDMGLLGALSLWWSSISLLALGGDVAPGVGSAGALLGLALTTGFLTHTLSLFLSAAGAKRTSDPTVLLAVLSILLPVLTLRLPPALESVASWALPPFHAAIELSGALRRASLADVVGPLLHILLFSGILLGLGQWLMARWRPRV